MAEQLGSERKLDDDEIRHAKIFISELLILGALEVRELRDLQERFTLDKYDAQLLQNRGLNIDTQPLIDSIEKEIDLDLDEKVSEVNTYLLTEPDLSVEIITDTDRIKVDSVLRVGDSIVPVVGDELYDRDVRNIAIGRSIYKYGSKSVYLANGDS